MVDTPTTNDGAESSLTTVSSMTTYSVSMTDSQPSVPFFEVQQIAGTAEDSVDKITLQGQDFTIWQPSSPTVDVLDGIRVTPP